MRVVLVGPEPRRRRLEFHFKLVESGWFFATTKCFSDSFVFKTKIEKEGLPRDDKPDSGACGHVN